jgi:hypothetical protein
MPVPTESCCSCSAKATLGDEHDSLAPRFESAETVCRVAAGPASSRNRSYHAKRAARTAVRATAAFGRVRKSGGDAGAPLPTAAYLSGGGVVKCPRVDLGGGPWACWIRRCARAPGLTSVRDPGWFRVGDKMFDGVIPLGEALRPLNLSRRFTRGACRQQQFGSRPRRIGVSEDLTRAKGWQFVVVSSGLAGTGREIAQPKPGSSGQSICALVGCRRVGAAGAAA